MKEVFLKTIKHEKNCYFLYSDIIGLEMLFNEKPLSPHPADFGVISASEKRGDVRTKKTWHGREKQ